MKSKCVKFAALLCGVSIGALAACQGAETEEYEGYELVWSDEFNDNKLDESKWSYQLGDGGDYGLINWGNGESEYYTDREENVSVSDGMLTIKVLNEDYEGYSYTSGRIRTMTDEGEVLFATAYGRVEARIQCEGGSGVWPAFWMLPVDTSIYGKWAASGELDIMEVKGRVPNKVAGTAHYGQAWPNNTYSGGEYDFASGTDIYGFHVYAIEWDPDKISWYVDDECYFEMDNWYAKGSGCQTNYTNPAPFDVPFYIILNVAVGGNFDPEAILKKDSLPAEMKVDYVRVYHRTEGYEECVAAENAKGDFHEIAGPVHANGNLIYNGSFDQGPNYLDYWNSDGLSAAVNADDTARQLKISAESEGTLRQSGLSLEAGAIYGVRFDVTAEKEQEITVRIQSSDGSVIAEEGIAVSVEQNYVHAFKFESEYTDSNCSIVFIFPYGAEILADNVIMIGLEK